MSTAPGTRLGPYEILDHLGSGGMGEVYRATDTRLGRTVAIKTLRGPHNDRFEREARAIAALNHPHICTLHDVGPDYLVMEYIEGSPLSGPLKAEDALRLALQIAQALEAAHRKGIIHRDLKPGNILVTDAGIKLLDFGLAKLQQENHPAAETITQTQAGVVLGTAAYMSPEQAEGKPADARSDVFSFGLVLYEMLSGRRAFSGQTSVSTMAAILHKEPERLDAPAELESIVKRCMRKAPSERYQSMVEVCAALQAVRLSKASPSIAVLPFANMSADPEQEYFGDGLAEEIINALTHVPGLRVIARTSAFAFKGKNEDVRRIAETLGVVNILEGSVRKAGNRVRVMAQLVSAADGSHLWSERYDRELTDVFAIQDEIAQSIAGALRLKLSAPAGRERRYNPNLPAYEAYLKARYFRGKLTVETMSRYRDFLEEAILLDVRFALAYVDLADLCLMRAFFGFPAIEELPRAREQARKALEMEPSLPEAHAILAIVACLYDHDWTEAERRFRLAMAEEPASLSDIPGWYGFFYLLGLDRPREAVAEIERALANDQLNILGLQCLANAHFAAGMLPEATADLQKCFQLEERLPVAYQLLAVIQACQGQTAEAIASAERSYSMGRWPQTAGLLAALLFEHGETGRAEALLSEVEPWGVSAAFAVFYLRRGDVDKAADWVEKAIEECHPSIEKLFLCRPFAQDLRASHRWAKICRMRNLPEP